MNIDDNSYKYILEKGLLLDHYFLLCNIKNNKPLLKSKRIEGFFNLLDKKGFLQDGKLTQRGEDLVAFSGFSEMISVAETTTQKEVNIATWVVELHKKCEDEIYALTGRKQVRAKILDRATGRKKSYAFLCHPTDLGNCLLRAIKAYKIKDFDAVEKALLAHIKRCNKEGDWFPLMEYYIIKEGKSKMVTDMASLEDEDGNSNDTPTQKFI